MRVIGAVLGESGEVTAAAAEARSGLLALRRERADGPEGARGPGLERLALLAGGLAAETGADAACLALPGSASDEEALALEARLRPLALRMVDAREAVWAGATGLLPGIVLEVGLWVEAYGGRWNGRREGTRGWGRFLGGDGGLYDLGLMALRRVAAALESAEGPTMLVEKVLSVLPDPSPERLEAELAAGLATPRRASQLASLVIDTALEGDAAARELLDRAADRQARLARAILLRTGLGYARPLVVARGALAEGSGLFSQFLRRAVRELLPGALLSPARFEPAVGAALLLLGLEEGDPQRMLREP
ncbi:MAG: hypothetical protein QJR14_08770, partial [Bacillota bacterium]|nr:hypothetical protein [Bacillota bacterium]